MATTYPMLQDAMFSLLDGGRHRCDPAWNKPVDGLDQCYKLYVPIRGQARLVLKTQEVSLRPGYAYLIPGYHLLRQECSRRMDVFWVHFVPESLSLSFLLSHIPSVQAWPCESVKYWQATWKEIPLLFQNGSLSAFYRMQAMLADLVSRGIENCHVDPIAAFDPVYEQLKPAVLYMEQRFLTNPTLAEIADTVHLAPNYFHRRFSAVFHVTPFAYLLRRRLNVGRQLLLSTHLTLDDIAARCGFSSAFHLSRLFTKHCGLSPSAFRRRSSP